MTAPPGTPGALPDWPEDLLPAPFADDARPGQLDVLVPLLRDPAPGRDVVVLLDGVGSELLAEHRALTPTLRRLAGKTRTVRTVHPATTAAAMVSLHTGLPPLRHGVLGYLTLDPATGRAVNQLTGDPAVDPARAALVPTLREQAGEGARRCLQVAPARHRGSHLSRIAYPGWDLVPHGRHDRADATVIAARRAGPDGLVHLHVDDVDHAGHHHGIASDAWRDALAEVDSLVGTLLRRLPRGTRVHVTADHGMVDTDPAHVLDLGTLPGLEGLRAELRQVTGEPRALSLHLRGDADPGAAAQRLQEVLGDRALVLDRERILTAGLLGPAGTEVSEEVAGRLPDVTVLARGRWVLDDLARRPGGEHRMIGVHGSLTSAEAHVPLLRVAS